MPASGVIFGRSEPWSGPGWGETVPTGISARASLTRSASPESLEITTAASICPVSASIRRRGARLTSEPFSSRWETGSGLSRANRLSAASL